MSGGRYMIQIKEGNEKEAFVTYIEQALKSLSHEDYDSFLLAFDTSRLSKNDLILALRYLDETRPVVKIDDPIMRNSEQDIYMEAFNDGSGYFIDYDLMTNGVGNDLTLQVEFIKEKDYYNVQLMDLRTL